MYIIGFFFIGILINLSKKLGKTRLMRSLSGFLYYSFLINLLIEGYLELAFGSLIQINGYVEQNKSISDIRAVSGEFASAISTLLTVVSLILTLR